MTLRRATMLAAMLVGVTSGIVRAQDMEPRAYSNTPVGMNFVLVGYGYTQGGVATDPALPLKDTSVHVHSTVAAYAHAFDLLGHSAKVDVMLPYGWASGSATLAGQSRKRDVDGFGDPRFHISANLYGAPALTLEQFPGWQQDVIVGASIAVTAPLGQYDRSKLLNIGTHRWSVRPEIGLSKALGPLTLEIIPSATIYSDNHDFLGSHTREQAPVYSVQGHLIYSMRFGLWGSVDGTYYGGGRTTVDGRSSDDGLNNARVGGTLAIPVDRHDSIKLYGSTSVMHRPGGGFDVVGLAWQFRWGGGL